MYQCPYNMNVKCKMDVGCAGCEDFKEIKSDFNWHDWMRDTVKVDVSDSKLISLIWDVIGLATIKATAKKVSTKKR